MSKFEQIFSLQSPTGAVLACRHLPAAGAPTGLVLLSHGMAEHAGRYGAFAERLSDRGFHVYAHDHRGHGETQAPDGPQGRFAGREGARCVLEDLLALREHASASHPGLPVILLGHSMGGLIALNFAETFPGKIEGLAVWNANFHGGAAGRLGQALLRLERMLKGSDVPSRILPDLTFRAWGRAVANRRTEFDWLSRDEDEVSRYIADPLCGFDCSVSLWIDVFTLVYAGGQIQALARLPRRLPIHLVGGSADPATDYGKAVSWLAARMKKSGLEKVTSIIYPQARHETLNELRPLREDAIETFSLWCLEVVDACRKNS
ncbi:alpha/beta hydrolase [Sinorhizobium sp. BG8]|uniref:alpha/beta fold hydrolase n=1 Tax=Sinorhizobium sp. BG8 TaxID=2613773 RepID=UPI00193D4805|nr:alpha/beta hydrolase [Sinorhizobium sp. BG8]QRM56019.1 alpha/beta hydrolase [Sinorhizobium sp. BG8]